MGSINSITISRDESHVLSVGQEKKLTYWDINATEPAHAVSLDGERDEGKCIARYNSFYFNYLKIKYLFGIRLFLDRTMGR